MEIEKIIEYLLIGYLLSGKIIYEMQNTNDLNIIYEIKELFKSYSLKPNLIKEKIKVGQYYINISLEKIIMISKTNANFSIEQNFELFERIKNRVPELVNYPLRQNEKRDKQNFTSKITNIIYDYFQYVNANKQIISEAYFKYKSKMILNNTIHKNYSKINYKLNKYNKLIKSENNKEIDKSSTRQFFKSRQSNIINNGQNKDLSNLNIQRNGREKDLIDNYFRRKNNIKNNKLNDLMLNQNKVEEEDNTDIIKSLYKTKNLFNMNESIKIINSKRISINQMISPKKNSKKKRFMILISFIIILFQLVSIPLIIINSYSY